MLQQKLCKKVYYKSYMAGHPVRLTTQSALHFTSWQTCSFQHQSDFSRKHSAKLKLLRETIFSHIYTIVYSQALIYIAEWTGAPWRERKCPCMETATKEIWTRAPSIESQAFYSWATALHSSIRYRHIWICKLGIACLGSEFLVKYNTYLVTNKSLSPINSLNQKVQDWQVSWVRYSWYSKHIIYTLFP